jgi:hypothetical protein
MIKAPPPFESGVTRTVMRPSRRVEALDSTLV